MEIAKKFNFDLSEFEAVFDSEITKKETLSDFQIVQDMGISGFPSIVLKTGSNLHLVANGFDSAENISKRIRNYASL